MSLPLVAQLNWEAALGSYVSMCLSEPEGTSESECAFSPYALSTATKMCGIAVSRSQSDVAVRVSE